MATETGDGEGGLWDDYLREFSYFSADSIRNGCHPRRYLHEPSTGRSLVLVHGLSDSPFCMNDLARFFHYELGYSVYLPLLQGHGLVQPKNMEGVRLDEWRKNVAYAVESAKSCGDRLSLGGLSTGGALALEVASEAGFAGDLYLFSAALGLYGFGFSLFGSIVEWVLRSPFVALLPQKKSGLVKDNPGRYERVPFRSARELCFLIEKLQDHMRCLAQNSDRLPCRIFSAWSEADRAISTARLKALSTVVDEEHLHTFVLPKSCEVEHACVVLEKSVCSLESNSMTVLEQANPRFREMVTAISLFEEAGRMS